MNATAPQSASREAPGSATYLITTCDGSRRQTYPAIGNIAALVNAAYDSGALGVTYRVLP